MNNIVIFKAKVNNITIKSECAFPKGKAIYDETIIKVLAKELYNSQGEFINNDKAFRSNSGDVIKDVYILKELYPILGSNRIYNGEEYNFI